MGNPLMPAITARPLTSGTVRAKDTPPRHAPGTGIAERANCKGSPAATLAQPAVLVRVRLDRRLDARIGREEADFPTPRRAAPVPPPPPRSTAPPPYRTARSSCGRCRGSPVPSPLIKTTSRNRLHQQHTEDAALRLRSQPQRFPCENPPFAPHAAPHRLAHRPGEFVTDHGQGHHRGGNRGRDGPRAALRDDGPAGQRRRLPRSSSTPRNTSGTCIARGWNTATRTSTCTPTSATPSATRGSMPRRAPTPCAPAASSRGTRVGIALRNYPEWVFAFMGNHVDRRGGRGAQRLVVRRGRWSTAWRTAASSSCSWTANASNA